MSALFVDLRIRSLREGEVFLRRPGNEIHLHIGQVRIVGASAETYTPGPRDLRAEAAAHRKLAGLALKAAAELEERANEQDARAAS